VRREFALALVLSVALAAGPGAAQAGEASARLALSGGGLSVSAPPDVALPPVTLTGDAVTVEAPAGLLEVVDARGSGAGWTLVAQAGRPVDARGASMGADLVLVPGAEVLPAGVRVGGPAPLAGGPRAIAEALPGAGAGTVVVTPRVRLRVPADTPSGAYRATLVVTVS
jgi:hypothetical protein